MKSTILSGLAAVAALTLGPVVAKASTSCPECIGTIYLSGVVLPHSNGDIFSFLDFSGSNTSFTGQKVTVALQLMEFPGNSFGDTPGPYISEFTATWSHQTSSDPFINQNLVRGEGGDGVPANDSTIFNTFDGLTSASLSGNNVQIDVESSMEYESFNDAVFRLSGDIALPGSHDFSTSFADTASGTILFNNDFNEFTYETDGDGSFEVTNFTFSAAPETSTWSLMLLGAAGAGMALRRRRRSLSVDFGAESDPA